MSDNEFVMTKTSHTALGDTALEAIEALKRKITTNEK